MIPCTLDHVRAALALPGFDGEGAQGAADDDRVDDVDDGEPHEQDDHLVQTRPSRDRHRREGEDEHGHQERDDGPEEEPPEE